jgi:hypothetical protein
VLAGSGEAGPRQNGLDIVLQSALGREQDSRWRQANTALRIHVAPDRDGCKGKLISHQTVDIVRAFEGSNGPNRTAGAIHMTLEHLPILPPA